MSEIERKILYLLTLLRDCDAISCAKDAYFFEADDVDVNAYVALQNADETIGEFEAYVTHDAVEGDEDE